jgi:hypothetical protein
MTTPQYDLSNTLPPHTLTRLAREWLAEDTPNFDPAGLCVGSHEVEARLLCKTPCSVLAGRPFFTAVFTELSCTVEWAHKEGAQLGKRPTYEPGQKTCGRVSRIHRYLTNVMTIHLNSDHTAKFIWRR